MSNLAFPSAVKPLFSNKYRELLAAISMTRPGTLDHDSLSLQLKLYLKSLARGCRTNEEFVKKVEAL